VKALICGLLLVSLAGCGDGHRSFEAPLVLGGREVAPDVLNRGEFVYMQRCRGCHGQHGRGNGTYASSLPIRPADLTRGVYPRLAEGGALPSDDALKRAVRQGIEGTPMGPQPVEGEDLEAVVQYVKTLAPVWREASQDVQ
jgi:mono/diheme cytochrome c family protein